ncbi:uncharacterized protein LOC125864056 [Solanum stenotomum]|uniref:uncharacterized protein LOC125864056 n=1 Tax=Solanum stenotomum TaxID=172797 RepID=UPI0020D1D3AA|nr:uncharacterized protein LOC125864056 [Solanum stenotomum]
MANKIDHAHPLFLSSSDVPGAGQIGIQLTGMENYTLWSGAMELTLLTKNKLGFWDQCNAMVLTWLMSNVSKDLVSGILFRSNATLVWSDLKERFDKDLWDEFDSIVPPPSCNCDRSKEYIDSMLRQKLLQFLMGLNDNYSHARSQILMMSVPPIVNQCYAMIIQDKSQRELCGDHYTLGGQLDSTALFSSRSGGNGSGSPGYRSQGNMKPHRPQRGGYLYCDHCEMKGHSKADCNKLKYCTHCHKHGHLKDICFQLIGYPANYKGKRLANNVSIDYGSLGSSNDSSCFVPSTQQSQQQYGSGFGAGSVPQFTPNRYNQVLQMLNKPLIHEGTTTSTNINANAASIFAGNSKFNSFSFNWIVDSGATDHMVGTKNVLTHGSTVMSSGQVQLPNGDSSRVTHSGCSKLQGGDVDLLTGRVKEIGEEDGGLYILKSPQLIDTGQHHKNLAAAAVKDSDKGSSSGSLLSDIGEYQRVVERLIYLTITRPDLSYAVQNLSQFMNAPKREKIQRGLVFIQHLATTEQLADVLTKGLGRLQHEYLVSKLGMKNIFISPSLKGGIEEYDKSIAKS